MCTSVSADLRGTWDAQMPKLEGEKTKTHICRLSLWDRGEIKQTATTAAQTNKHHKMCAFLVLVSFAKTDLQTRRCTNLLHKLHLHRYCAFSDISKRPRAKTSFSGLVNRVCASTTATGGVKECRLSCFRNKCIQTTCGVCTLLAALGILIKVSTPARIHRQYLPPDSSWDE